jgi:NADH:ubiquinone oxidoreductase subunit D
MGFAKNDPYSIYDRFDFDIPVGRAKWEPLATAGTATTYGFVKWNRACVIIEQALEQRMPDEGDVMEAIPQTNKNEGRAKCM